MQPNLLAGWPLKRGCGSENPPYDRVLRFVKACKALLNGSMNITATETMDNPLLGAAATSSSTPESRGPLSTLPLPTAAELPDSEPPATETRYAGRSGFEDDAEEEYDPDQSRYDEDPALDGGRRLMGVIEIFGYRFRPATSFAFCFGLREAMLIFVGMQFLSGVFWLYVRARSAAPLLLRPPCRRRPSAVSLADHACACTADALSGARGG